jgi:hypothetical protein
MKGPTVTFDPQAEQKGVMSGIFNIPYSTYGLTLQQLAALGGYDHFNFGQNIVAFSKDGLTHDYISPFNEPALGRGLGLDPLEGGKPLNIADNWPEYWDEVPIFNRSDLYVFGLSNQQTSFVDEPNLV